MVGAVQRVDSGVVLLPRAGVAGLPPVGQGVSVRVDVVGIGRGPVSRGLGGLSMRRQTFTEHILQQVPPHVLAQVAQAIAVRIPILVRGVARIECPEVASVVDVADPPTMLHLPAVGHAVAVRIRVGGVSRAVGSPSGTRPQPSLEVDLFGKLARLLVAQVLVVEVVAVEVGRLCEPPPVLLAVGQAVAVGVNVTWVGAVESALRD